MLEPSVKSLERAFATPDRVARRPQRQPIPLRSIGCRCGGLQVWQLLQTNIYTTFIGRVTSSYKPLQSSDDEDTAASRAHSQSKSHRSRGKNHRRQESETDKTERLSKSLVRALGQPDATKRGNSSWAILDQINHENWREILDSFHVTAKDKGFMDGGMHGEALKRVGQVCGKEAAEYYTAKGEKIHGSIFYGWGMSQPDEALAWVKNHISDAERSNHIHSVIVGAARLQHERGAALMDAQPAHEWRRTVTHFVWNTVRGPGIDSAEAWALKQTDQNRKEAALASVQGSVISSAALGRSPEKLAAWITATADGTPAAAQRAHSIIASTLKHQPEHGAQLMYTLKSNNHVDLDTMMAVMQSSLTDKNTPALLK